jgi:hypothetical protein
MAGVEVRLGVACLPIMDVYLANKNFFVKDLMRRGYCVYDDSVKTRRECKNVHLQSPTLRLQLLTRHLSTPLLGEDAVGSSALFPVPESSR